MYWFINLSNYPYLEYIISPQLWKYENFIKINISISRWVTFLNSQKYSDFTKNIKIFLLYFSVDKGGGAWTFKSSLCIWFLSGWEMFDANFAVMCAAKFMLLYLQNSHHF